MQSKYLVNAVCSTLYTYPVSEHRGKTPSRTWSREQYHPRNETGGRERRTIHVHELSTDTHILDREYSSLRAQDNDDGKKCIAFLAALLNNKIPASSWYHAFDYRLFQDRNYDTYVRSPEKTDRTRVPEVGRTAATALLRVFTETAYCNRCKKSKRNREAHTLFCYNILLVFITISAELPNELPQTHMPGIKTHARDQELVAIFFSPHEVLVRVSNDDCSVSVCVRPRSQTCLLLSLCSCCGCKRKGGLGDRRRTLCVCVCVQKRADLIQQQGWWGLAAVSGDRRKACGIPRLKGLLAVSCERFDISAWLGSLRGRI